MKARGILLAALPLALLVGCGSSTPAAAPVAAPSPVAQVTSQEPASPVAPSDVSARLSCSWMSQVLTNQAFDKPFQSLLDQALTAGAEAEYTPLHDAAVAAQQEDPPSAISDYLAACKDAGLGDGS